MIIWNLTRSHFPLLKAGCVLAAITLPQFQLSRNHVSSTGHNFPCCLDYMGPNLCQAAMRGVWLAAELGYSLSPINETLLTRQFSNNTLHHYNVPNTVKNRTMTKVRFKDTVLSTKKDTPTSIATVSAMELLLMGAYYSVSLQEMRHHVATRSHNIQNQSNVSNQT